MKIKSPTLQLPKFRLYQQIIICFVLVVLVPLVGVSFTIYSINQKALKKELAKFTEYTAKSLYKDFGTEMIWQRKQAEMTAAYMRKLTEDTRNFGKAAQEVFSLGADYEAIGYYDAKGHLLNAAYRDFTRLSPELRLPQDLRGNPKENPFEVVYFSTGNPKDSPYYLRTTIPIQSGAAAYYVQQKQFQYLQNLVRSKQSLFDAFYIIDGDGVIIAGPTDSVEQQERINPESFRQFQKTRPGVIREFSTTAPTVNNASSGDSEDDPPLQKVVVKMPGINWGVIIESPYNVRQKYIKRARNQTFLLILGCIAAVVLLALIYIFGISRNFRQLIKGIKAMADGNYFRRIRLITNFFTPYEIVYLAGEFNRMARKTADAWTQIQTLNQELLEANRKLAKLDELKSNLIDTVSHELRTPLTSIKGYTSRLLRYDGTLDAETRIKSLKVVKQQADRLGRLVDDLLVIPDLESATLRVFPDQVALAPLIESSVQFIQAKEHREIEVELPASDVELSVLADPDRLEQILLNLLDNAVKYSLPETPIKLGVEARASAANQPSQPAMIEIRVSNRCEPIPQEELSSLFEKFKRLDDSLIRTTRGSGLGLFITKGLVEAMGGQILLAYHEGYFHVTFTVPSFEENLVEESA